MAGTIRVGPSPLLRYSDRDAILIALSLAYAALLLSVPSIVLIGVGLWWTANTVARERAAVSSPLFLACRSTTRSTPVHRRLRPTRQDDSGRRG